MSAAPTPEIIDIFANILYSASEKRPDVTPLRMLHNLGEIEANLATALNIAGQARVLLNSTSPDPSIPFVNKFHALVNGIIDSNAHAEMQDALNTISGSFNLGIPPIAPLPTAEILASLKHLPKGVTLDATIDELLWTFPPISIPHPKQPLYTAQIPALCFRLLIQTYHNIAACKKGCRLRDCTLFHFCHSHGAESETLRRAGNNLHPHINSQGKPCFGDSEPAILSALCRLDLCDVAHLILTFLRDSYDESSAYAPLIKYCPDAPICNHCGNIPLDPTTMLPCGICKNPCACCEICLPYKCSRCRRRFCPPCSYSASLCMECRLKDREEPKPIGKKPKQSDEQRVTRALQDYRAMQLPASVSFHSGPIEVRGGGAHWIVEDPNNFPNQQV